MEDGRRAGCAQQSLEIDGEPPDAPLDLICRQGAGVDLPNLAELVAVGDEAR